MRVPCTIWGNHPHSNSQLQSLPCSLFLLWLYLLHQGLPPALLNLSGLGSLTNCCQKMVALDPTDSTLGLLELIVPTIVSAAGWQYNHQSHPSIVLLHYVFRAPAEEGMARMHLVLILIVCRSNEKKSDLSDLPVLEAKWSMEKIRVPFLNKPKTRF